MQNFVYCNPTDLVFGRGAHKEIGMRMLPWAKDGKKALVIYGGGSAKRSGVLDDVVGLRSRGPYGGRKGRRQAQP